MKKPYTVGELDIIKQNCKLMTIEQLLELLPNRSLSSLKTKIYELGLRPISKRIDWTKEEKQTLILNFPTSSKNDLLALFPSKSPCSIKDQARKLGLTKNKDAIKKSRKEAQILREDLWNPYEDEIVKKFYPIYGSEITVHLPNRSTKTITARAIHLGVKYHNERLWTKEMEDFLIIHYQEHVTITSLTDALNKQFNSNKTYNAVNSKLGHMGINMTGVKIISSTELNLVQTLIEQGLSDTEITNKLNWDETRVKTIRKKLGILRHQPWTEFEEETLYNLYPLSPMREIRKMINRSVKMIHWKARELGIERRVEIPQCSKDIYSKNLSEIWTRAKAEERFHQGDDWSDYKPMSHDEVIFLYEYFDKKCSYCYREYNAITFDHFIPMVSGGRLTKDNTILCCHNCNTSKQDSNFEVWYQKKHFSNVKDKQKTIQKIYEYFKLVSE